MARSQFAARLEKRVRERVQSLASSIASGEAPDYPAYKYHCGEIKGLEEALLIADEVEQEFEAQ